MAVFPTLKSGAVAQYPLERQMQFSTQVMQFVDGTEQRFREFGKALRKWVIRLEMLDASELQVLADFFDELGPVVAFSFTDPIDGTVYPRCSIAGGTLTTTVLDEFNSKTELTIQENRT